MHFICILLNTSEETYYVLNLILRFQDAIKKYGVPHNEVFQTADLFERRNLKQVTLSLLALARIVRLKNKCNILLWVK